MSNPRTRRKVAQEDRTLKDDGVQRYDQSDKNRDRRTGNKLGHNTEQKVGQQVCASTDKPCEEAKEEIWEDVRARKNNTQSEIKRW